MRKTFCDVCGTKLDMKTMFGGRFRYRGPNTVTWSTMWDLCEKHGEETLRFIHSLRKTASVEVE